MAIGVVSVDSFNSELARLGIIPISDSSNSDSKSDSESEIGSHSNHEPHSSDDEPHKSDTIDVREPEIVDVVNEEIRLLVHGRGSKPETPAIVRELIAAEATAGASSKVLQGAFNVSGSSVSAYKNGAKSTASYHDKDPGLVDAIDKTNESIARIATGKIMRALGAITDSKVDELSPLKAADLAQKMSNVVKNMKPDEVSKDSGVKIVVFQPRVKEEDEFEIVQVLEE